MTIGAIAGLLDGLAFVLSHYVPVHSPVLRVLVPVLLILNLPGLAVIMRLDGPDTPEWVPWTAGVLTMGAIGAAVGLIIYVLREQRTGSGSPPDRLDDKASRPANPAKAARIP